MNRKREGLPPLRLAYGVGVQIPLEPFPAHPQRLGFPQAKVEHGPDGNGLVSVGRAVHSLKKL